MADVAGGDFETRSAVDLPKCGVYHYAEHPTTDVWCLSYYFDFEPVQLWEMGMPAPERLVQHVKDGKPFKAWNAQFERVIWNYILHGRYGWPKLKIDQTYCTQAQAMTNGLPAALDKTAEALGLVNRKDEGGRKLMLQMCRPRLRNTDGTCLWWDDNERRRRLARYCVQDSEVERTVASRLRPMSDDERSIWVLDQEINQRGYLLDFELVHAGLTMVGHTLRSLDADVKHLTQGMVENTRKRRELLNWLWLHDMGDIDSIDKYALAAMLRRNDLEAATRTVLSIRQEAAKSSNAKLHVMQRAVCKDGRMRGTLQYYGAGRTGRWAGKLLQPHNFPKGHIDAADIEEIVAAVKQADADLNFELVDMLYGPPLDVMASLLRGCIIAAERHDLFVADFNAIEARVLAWLANERRLLHLFKTGGDPYRAMASDVYRVAKEDVTADQRWLGKQLVLGCGFQQGSDSFQQRLQKEGIEVDDDFAAEAINSYRRSNQNIVGLWDNMQTAAMEAIRNPGAVYSNGKIGFCLKWGMLFMKLPGGRFLSYIRPTIETVTTERNGEPWTRQQIMYWGVDPVSYRWAHLYTYGGKLTENAVQAIARNALAKAMKRVSAAGYPIVLHVHDEIVAEVPSGWGSLDEFERYMAMVPPEIEGCPIKVSAWRGRRYRK